MPESFPGARLVSYERIHRHGHDLSIRLVPGGVILLVKPSNGNVGSDLCTRDHGRDFDSRVHGQPSNFPFLFFAKKRCPSALLTGAWTILLHRGRRIPLPICGKWTRLDRTLFRAWWKGSCRRHRQILAPREDPFPSFSHRPQRRQGKRKTSPE